MSNILFVKPDWHYDPYIDYYLLVEYSQFPIIRYNQMDPNSDNIYIVSPANGQLKEHIDSIGKDWKSHSCKLMLWNLERPGGSGTIEQYVHDNRQLIESGYIDRVLVSDYRLAEDSGFWFVPIGSHPDLGRPGDLSEKHYDVVHLMSYTGRRSDSWYKDPGITVAPNGWGDVKDVSLRASKLMINIHQDDDRFLEPLRFSLAAAYGLPIITESCLNIYPYDTSRAVIQCERENMLQTIRMVLKNYTEWYYRGLDLRDKFTRNVTFRSCLERHI